ncbi:MAG: metalloregulator ArsR/SmtB family transcription factor [Pseudomonadota bacterium]
MEKQDALNALGALAHGTRLDIFRALVVFGRTGMPAGALASQLALPAATLSFHLKELRQAGLVSARRDGRSIIYAAAFETVESVIAYLVENCCQAADEPCVPSSGADGEASCAVPTHGG